MLISTSKDLLFVVLAFCALWLTVFLSWLMYYLIAILRDTEKVMRAVTCVVEKVDQLTHAVHDKFERSASSMSLVGQALKELVVWGIKQRSEMNDSESSRGSGKKKK